MGAYDSLAGYYDALTRDVDYKGFADWFEARFRESGAGVKTVLDLACGTATLTCIMAERGYETIGVDGSPEMLSRAMEKSLRLCGCEKPLLLCQRLDALDLFGTVDAAICCLDGLNYLTGDELEKLFSRLRLFVRPGGLLLFDLLSPERLREACGGAYVDEAEDVFCVWRGAPVERGVKYGMDIFIREGALWRRESEEHTEYTHEPEKVLSLLGAAGFTDVEIRYDGPESEKGRIFFSAVRG